MTKKPREIKKGELAVVILNFNGLEDTLNCIESVEQYTEGIDYYIIVVENNSKNRFSNDHSKQFSSRIEIIDNHTNRGFAGGCNDGINRAIENRSEYILLLNNDTFLTDNCFYKLIQAHKNLDKKLLAVGPVNYFPDSIKVWQAGIYNNLKTGRTNTIKNPDYSSEWTSVDYVSGSCFLTTRDAYIENSVFDEAYFAYGEENDWCLDLKKKGGEVFVINNAKIYHDAGASSNEIIKTYLRLRNRLYFYKKFSKVVFLPFIYLRIYLLLLKVSLSGKHKKRMLKAILLGTRDFFVGKMYFGSIDKL